MASKVVRSLATAVLLVAVIPVGLFFVWLLLVAVCNFPPLAFGVACGHNAWVWLPLFIPAGFYLAWKLLSLIKNKAFKAELTEPSKGENDA